MTTFSKIFLHVVFRVKYPYLKLESRVRIKVYKYISGIISNHGHKPIKINGTEDHIHILIGLKPNVNISQFIKEIKRCSTNYINENQLIKYKFRWQVGFGVFSYTHYHLEQICNYINNQEKHHKNVSTKDEFKKLLDDYHIKYDPKWIFSDDGSTPSGLDK